MNTMSAKVRHGFAGKLNEQELFEFFRDADLNLDGLVTLPEYSQYAITMG